MESTSRSPAPWLVWIMAARPKTLTASIIPILGTTGIALRNLEGSFPFDVLIYAIMATLFLQVGTNYVNDSLDYQKGADTSKRLGPPRATHQGWIKPKHMLYAAFLCFIIASVLSLPLILRGGLPILLILFISLICSYGYTGGVFPLAYKGLGDIFVLIFYGWIAHCGMFYLYTGSICADVFILGTEIGLLCTTLIAINNFRDFDEDKISGKKTLAVRFGKVFARGEIIFLLTVPYLFHLFWFVEESYLVRFFPMLVSPFCIYLIKRSWSIEPSIHCNQLLAYSSSHAFIFSTSVFLGFYFS
ncbi:MAG: 1,4-dihydroxy-2-naphthoate polyprenyltransferase [Chlamydiales bacterium]